MKMDLMIESFICSVRLCQVLRNYNFNNNLIQVTQGIYTNPNSAVLTDNSIAELFKTTIGVRQGYLLSPLLVNIFLESIMEEALKKFHTSITIGQIPISKVHFAENRKATVNSRSSPPDWRRQ